MNYSFMIYTFFFRIGRIYKNFFTYSYNIEFCLGNIGMYFKVAIFRYSICILSNRKRKFQKKKKQKIIKKYVFDDIEFCYFVIIRKIFNYIYIYKCKYII